MLFKEGKHRRAKGSLAIGIIPISNWENLVRLQPSNKKVTDVMPF